MASVVTFQAHTGSFPGTADLSWALDSALSPTESVVIRRAQSIYPLSNEGTVVVDTVSSDVTTYHDSELAADTFYYYTIFIYDSVTMKFTDFGRLGQSFALSYQDWGEGQRLYNLLATDVRSVHEVLGGDRNDLWKVFQVMGNMMNYYRSLVTTAGYWRRPEIVQENWLDFYSLMFAFQPERGFDLRVLRNMALSLVGIYKRKGTCGALVDFIKVFTTWDSHCDDTVDLTFRWWDPDTKRTLSYLTGVSANKAIDTNQSWTADIWQNGKFTDPLDDIFYLVLGNDATTVNFSSKTPPFYRLDGTAGSGIDAVTFQDLTKSWIADEWRGFRLYIDSFSSSEYFSIVGNDSQNLFLNHKQTNFGNPSVLQMVGVDMVAPSPGQYRIEPEYSVQQGRHSLTYDNTLNPAFLGTLKDPANFYFGGNRSLLTLGQFSAFSVLIVIDGVAEAVGRSSTLTSSVLTDTNANFGGTNNLIGFRLNPNTLQAQDFEIISNTPTSITVLGDLTKVAAVQNNYYVLDQLSSTRVKRLREVLSEFCPRDIDIFIFFEPKV